MTGVVRVIAVAATAMLLAAASVALRGDLTHRTDMVARPSPQVFTGLYDPERSPDGLTYAWSRPAFGLTLRGVNRRVPVSVTLRMRAARPDGATPSLLISVDGVVVDRGTLTADFEERTVTLPSRDGSFPTQVDVLIDPPFVPAGDPRALGAQVDWVEVTGRGEGFLGLTSSMWQTIVPMLLPVGLIAAGIRSVPWALALSAMFAALWITMAGHNFGTFVTWPVTGLTIASLAAAAVTRAIVGRSTVAAGLVAIATAATALRLLALAHPAMPIGDGLFHAHRLQSVLAGNLYFTSITPGDYQFPYAPGLYMLAAVFSGLYDSALDKLWLLRQVTVVTDGVAGAVLGWWVWHWRRRGVDAAGAAVAYLLLPLGFEVLAVGNLTNAFAQSVAVMSIAVLAVESKSTSHVAAIFGLMLLAAVSHTSTFVLLSAHVSVAAAWLWLAQPDRRATAWRWAALSTGVVAVAVVIYYGHFGEVYQTAAGRIAQETGTVTAAAGFRSPEQRLFDVPRLLHLYYTVPALLLAGWGLISERQSRGSESQVGQVVLRAGLLVWAVFLLVGIVTPVDLRHYLAAIPWIAVAAAFGLSAGRAHGGWTAGIAVTLASALVAAGVLATLRPLW